jgi:hypothetical protein
MKNLSRIALLMVVAFSLNACKVSEQHAASKVAKDFLDNLNAKKYAKAKKLSTKESAASIDMLESLSRVSNDDKPAPLIENLMCRVDGDRATCDYMENGEQKKLDLVKIRGKWLVEMKKESPDVNNANSGSNREQMIEDSIRAADQIINNRENYTANDTATYFDIGIIDMYDLNGSVHLKFYIANRSEWNIAHFWLQTYISSRAGKFIQKNDLMFDGILKSQMLHNISNIHAVLEKNKIELILKNTGIDDIGEVFLMPVRIQFDPADNGNMPFDMGTFNIARYIKLRNDSAYSVNITF